MVAGLLVAAAVLVGAVLLLRAPARTEAADPARRAAATPPPFRRLPVEERAAAAEHRRAGITEAQKKQLELAQKVFAGLKNVTGDSQIEEMKLRFEAGQDLYEHKRYEEAADAFLEAYEITPAVSLQYNAAVGYEKAGKFCRALERFQRYLDEKPDVRDCDEVADRIVALAERCSE